MRLKTNPLHYSFNWRRITRHLLVWLFLTAVLVYTIWPFVFASGSTHRTLVVYGFSILDKVMNEGIYPEFKKEWEKKHGEKINFISSFAGSGTITNQIIMGVPAEIAIVSVEPDAFRMAENGLTPTDSWKRLPHQGTINLTPFIILVRAGNPLNIKNFSDLSKKGVQIIHPDPLTSGGAQWAILAEYGSEYVSGNKSNASSLLQGIWNNVISQAASARAARTQFNNGFGNILITYEQEALFDKMKGKLSGEIVYPQSTILSEHKVVVLDKNISRGQQDLVRAFVKFLWTERAQKIFVRYGFRSIDEKLNEGNTEFGEIEKPFKVDNLGGWKSAKKEIIDNIWKEKILKRIKK